MYVCMYVFVYTCSPNSTIETLLFHQESRRRPSKTTRSRSSYPWRSGAVPTIASHLAKSLEAGGRKSSGLTSEAQ